MKYFLKCVMRFFGGLFKAFALAFACFLVGLIDSAMTLVVCVSFAALLYREAKEMQRIYPRCYFDKHYLLEGNADFMLALDGAMYAVVGIMFTALGYRYSLLL